MARTSVKSQSWKPTAQLRVAGLPKASTAGQPVTASLLDAPFELSKARVVWRARELVPVFGARGDNDPAQPWRALD